MTIGIIGGGQLGMMLAESCKKRNLKTVALDPNPKCSCSKVVDHLIVASYDDKEALKELADMVDVITYEFENVNSDSLDFLEQSKKLKQGVRPLRISQNRIIEKKFALENGLTPVPYFDVFSLEDLKKAIDILGFPVIYKTATLGYDGHGQTIIRNQDDLAKVKLVAEGVCEKMIDFDYEASIIMIADEDNICYLPISVNISSHNILDLSIVDDNVSLKDKIISDSVAFMKKSKLQGIITLEYFIKEDKLYFNEMAPRPHNSGHYSIEACDYSQYDMLVKYLLGEKLTNPKLLHLAIMKNILGYNYDFFNKLDINYKHDYYKDSVKEFRKMAHITFLDVTYSDYLDKYKKLFKEV